MIKSKKHLAFLLNTKWDRLEYIVSNLDKYYYKKEEAKYDKDGNPRLDSKGNIKIRVIYPSTGDLKFLQDKINKRILRNVKLSNAAYGGVKGKDNISNSKTHLGKKFKFVTDLKDCFPSINSGMVYQSFVRNGFSADIASMLTKLTTYKNQIPQGARTSTYVCNIVMQIMDEKLLELCVPNDIVYTRYIDDLTFSSQSDFKHLNKDIIKVIQSESLKLSHAKTWYVLGSTLITGIRVPNNSIDISDEMKTKISSPGTYNEKQKKGQHLYTKRVVGEERLIKLIAKVKDVNN